MNVELHFEGNLPSIERDIVRASIHVRSWPSGVDVHRYSVRREKNPALKSGETYSSWGQAVTNYRINLESRISEVEMAGK